MYTKATNKVYRPNTRKLYEAHHGVTIPAGYEVHHVLPVRLGGTHDVKNLVVLSHEEHALAHLELYRQFGDVRDLCAYHMISGRDEDAHLAACAAGGVVSQRLKKERNELNGFQLFDEAKRKKVAAKAGSIGGRRQKELGLGIHVDAETRRVWARLGGLATVEQHGFTDSARQAERGKRGGVKNAGSRWYNDGSKAFKYTKQHQLEEEFDVFIARTGFNRGRLK